MQNLENLSPDAIIHDGAHVHPRATVEAGAEIFPMVYIGEGCTVKAGAKIMPFSTLINGASVGAGSVVMHSYIDGSTVGQNCSIGPFAHLRGNTLLHDEIKIGNFVETKNTEVKSGVFVSHLSYLGDADVGAGVNVGAGTITANFNSITGAKTRTVIGDKASLGANSVLVAPVKIGEDAYVGAGTVVTEDVPPKALALGRCRTQNRPGWVDDQRKKTQNLPKN